MAKIKSDMSDDCKEISNRIVGPSLENLKLLVTELAKKQKHTLFIGDTGTGKELFGELFMSACPRATKRTINCAAYINEDALQSALFGHTKGAYTGATSERKGLAAVCDRGVIFLDELGDASGGFQASLLRLRETGDYYPFGSDNPKGRNRHSWLLQMLCFAGKRQVFIFRSGKLQH
jgi:transcriptional regulator with GAF, ATPase, and Fis domain